MIADLTPVQQFFAEEVKPHEFVAYLDAVEHECLIGMLTNTERIDRNVIVGVGLIREFKKTLERCK